MLLVLKSWTLRILLCLVALAVLAVAGYLVATAWRGIATIEELLTENRQLKAALSRLTAEEQIGYAKVIRQEERDGVLHTTLKFVETARGDSTRRVLEKICTIQGDIIHFDALIVTFDKQLVMDGEARSLYLWRRVYGDGTPPSQGCEIQTPGTEPARYRDLLDGLKMPERTLFWQEIWALANDRDRLSNLGVEAIYGNAVYQRLQPGLIYIFTISNTGQLIPKAIPDI